MVRYEEDKLVIELDLNCIDSPKTVRNEFLRAILFLIGHLNEEVLQMASSSELYYLTLLADALVTEEGDVKTMSGNNI